MPDTLQELERERQGIFRQIDELEDFRAGSITGKSAGCPTFLPVAGAGRTVTDSRSGVKADTIVIFTFPGCPCRVGGELHSDHGPKSR